MSEQLLNKIFEKLVDMDNKIDSLSAAQKRMEQKLDATIEQTANTAEDTTYIKDRIDRIGKDMVTHEHHFNVVDKQLVQHAIDIDKNR